MYGPTVSDRLRLADAKSMAFKGKLWGRRTSHDAADGIGKNDDRY